MSALVSEKELQAGAIQAYAEVIGKEQKEGDLNANPAMTQRVRAIAARLIPQTGAFRKDAPGWKWEVNVIRSDELNAWCMPGGKIAFYSGDHRPSCNSPMTRSRPSWVTRSPTRCASMRASALPSRRPPASSSASGRRCWAWATSPSS